MEIKVIAKSPISHGAFTDGVDTGNIMEFRRMPIVVDGKTVQIPVISGNALRGKMRRLLAREFFRALDIKNVFEEKEQDKLYAILGNGGALGKDAAAEVDVNAIRELRNKVPLLSVFGAACYKYILQGMFNCGFLILNCREAKSGDMSISDLVAEIGETHHIDRTMFDAEKNEMKPMPYTTEVVVQGAEFTGNIEFSPQATEQERAAVYHGLKLISTVGGKSARGYGRVDISCGCDIDDSLYIDALKNTDIDFVRKYIRGLL